MVKIAHRRKSKVLVPALTPEEKALNKIESASRAPAPHMSASSRFDLDLLPDIFDPGDMEHEESLYSHHQFKNVDDISDEHGIVIDSEYGTFTVAVLDPVDAIAQEIYTRTGDPFFAVA